MDTTPLTPEELDTLSQLAQAATPGPWQHVPGIGTPEDAEGNWPPVDKSVWPDRQGVEQDTSLFGKDAYSIFYADKNRVGATAKNAAYIAAANPDTVLRLVQQVQALQHERRLIPVTERLPERATTGMFEHDYSEDVLLFLHSNTTPLLGYYDYRVDYQCFQAYNKEPFPMPTHWMPLPAVPGQEGGQQG